MFMYLCMYMNVCMYACSCMYVCMYVCMNVCMLCMYVCMCLQRTIFKVDAFIFPVLLSSCMYVCMYVGKLFVHAGFQNGVKLPDQHPWGMMTMRSLLSDGRTSPRFDIHTVHTYIQYIQYIYTYST